MTTHSSSDFGLVDLFNITQTNDITAGPKSKVDMSDEVVSASHGIPRSSLIVKKGKVVRDGEIAAAVAEKLFREYCSKCSISDEEERNEVRVALAVALCHGTSAETNLSERFLDADDYDSNLSHLADVLTAEGSPLAGRTNYLRVFARSLPGFADLTRDVINGNGWLRQQRALDYEVDVSVAGVCFDYAESLSLGSLSPGEKNVLTFGLRKKGREGRSVFMSAEGVGVRGSDPVSRGVGSSIVPDAGRVGSGGGRGGAGPYA